MLHIFGKYVFPHLIIGDYEVEQPHLDLIRELSSPKSSAIIFPRGFAKTANSLDTQILTPAGFVKLGELKVGDFIIGGNGKRKRVTKLHPISEMDLYRVTTRDGRSALSNLDHLWQVTCPSNTGDRLLVKSLAEIKENFRARRYDKRAGKAGVEFRYFIPTVDPVHFPAKRLPIDPYTLGAWLGDGSSEGARITSDDAELISYFPYKTTKQGAKFMYNIWELKGKLRGLNLLQNKHIPDVYLFGSIKQRMDLLQGLIDTDGYVVKGGRIVGFCNTNRKIIDGFIHLVRGLGGTCTLREQLNRFDKNSTYRKSWVVTARFPAEIIPCRLSRKRNLWKGSLKTKSAIVKIEFEKRGLGRCISVEDELYVVDDFLLTHNTWERIDTIHDICYKAEPVILYISSTLKDAQIHFEAIKSEFENNELLTMVYGWLVPDPKDVGRKWTNTHIETTNGVNLVARGAGKGRGVNIKGKRPTKILFDDVEDDEALDSQHQRAKLHRWIYRVIFNSRDKDRGRIKFIGTVISPLCEVLLFYRNFGGIFRKAIEAGQSICPQYFPLAKLLGIRDGYTGPDGKFVSGIGTLAFCNPFEAPILMADWSFKPIGEVREGDEVIGFVFDNKKMRRLVKSKVKKTFSRVALTQEMLMSNGDYIRCTPEHKWFTGRFGAERIPCGNVFKRKSYAPARIGSQLMKVIDIKTEGLTIEQQLDYKYLAGIIDGEGSCIQGSISITQSSTKNPATYLEIKKVLDRLNIPYRICGQYKTKRAEQFVLSGGRERKIDILRNAQPAKKQQIIDDLFNSSARFIKEKPTVDDIKLFKKERVYALETETGNYIAWGYASSNSQEYLNTPIDESLAKIKMEWLEPNFYTAMEKKNDLQIIIMFDPQSGEKAGADSYGLAILGRYREDRHRYLIRIQTGKATQLEQAGLFVRTVQEFGAQVRFAGIEKIMTQVAVYQLVLDWLAEKIELPKVNNKDRNLSVIAVSPEGKDKVARLEMHQPAFERGEIHLHSTMGAFAEKLTCFPAVEHDDDIDAVIYCLEYANRMAESGIDPSTDPEDEKYIPPPIMSGIRGYRF